MVLLLISLGLLSMGLSGVLQPVTEIVSTPLSALQRWIAQTMGSVITLIEGGDVAALQRRNAELEKQVAELQARLIEQSENENELHILSSLLDYARTHAQYRYRAANVIGHDPSPFLNYIILDVGSDAGIRRDMPVVAAQGLVGRVTEVTSVACKVQLITDIASAVNARLQKSRDEGVVIGIPGGGLEMQYLSQQAQVAPGDIVLTSGLGGRFPPDLIIGTVTAVQKLDYEVLQSATLTPAVDFKRLEIVLIIVNFTPVDFSPFQ